MSAFRVASSSSAALLRVSSRAPVCCSLVAASRYSSSSDAESSSAARAKANAWYLDPKLATPTKSAPVEKRQPVFTTFNPDTTLPDAPTELAQADPPPSNLPAHLLEFHEYMANETLLVAASIHFYDTQTAAVPATETEESDAGGPALDIRVRRIPQGKRGRRGGDAGDVGMEVGPNAGANWKWIVVAEVAARGKGAVGRAERAIREWLHNHPRVRSVDPAKTSKKTPKFSSPTPDADWSLISVSDELCVNLLTNDGRQRWGLEDVWSKSI